jgi:hypothetical protein
MHQNICIVIVIYISVINATHLNNVYCIFLVLHQHLAFHHQTTTINNNDDGDENENENENIRGNTKNEKKKKIRSWLTLGGLFNFPRKNDFHPDRDISLPLSYSSFDSEDKDKESESSSFPIQDRDPKNFVDGTVDHIVELSTMIDINTGNNKNNFDFFPFYGHVTKFLEEINDAFADGAATAATTATTASSSRENETNDSDTSKIKEIMLCNPRPTRSFVYDWRRNLFELTSEFYQYCEEEFPDKNTKIQIVAHSLGGLIAYGTFVLLNFERLLNFISYLLFSFMILFFFKNYHSSSSILQ